MLTSCLAQFISAIAMTISDYWYYYPQKKLHGNSRPLLGWPSFIKWKSGWLTLQEEKKKGGRVKTSSCYDATLMQTQQSEDRMSLSLFCFSPLFLSPWAVSDSITRELMEALSWNFLNSKMVTLCNYLDPNAVLLPKQENLVAVFLSRNSSPSPSALFQESYTRITFKLAKCLSGTSEIK